MGGGGFRKSQLLGAAEAWERHGEVRLAAPCQRHRIASNSVPGNLPAFTTIHILRVISTDDFPKCRTGPARDACQEQGHFPPRTRKSSGRHFPALCQLTPAGSKTAADRSAKECRLLLCADPSLLVGAHALARPRGRRNKLLAAFPTGLPHHLMLPGTDGGSSVSRYVPQQCLLQNVSNPRHVYRGESPRMWLYSWASNGCASSCPVLPCHAPMLY